MTTEKHSLPKKGKKLAGQRFGMLECLSYLRTEKRNAVWKCLCDCGKIYETTTNRLCTGKSTSCGCNTNIKRAKSISKAAIQKHVQNPQWVVDGLLARAELKHGVFCVIDIDDLNLAMSRKWLVASSMGKSYAYSTTSPKEFLHCLIMGRKFIDHIDGNGLNNRRSNLRFANSSQNQANKSKQKTPSSSQFKGVCKTPSGKWRAEVTCNKVVYRLGLFQTEMEAALAYDAKAKELFGEYAKTNLN